MPDRLQDEGRLEIVESGFSASHVATPNFINHVLGHFLLGTLDEYSGKDANYWTGDISQFSNIVRIDEFYFIQLAKMVTNEMTNPTGTKPVTGEFFNTNVDNTSKTELSKEYKQEQTERKANPQTPNPPPEPEEE